MFWRRQTTPVRVPTDTVVPLKFLDDSIINRTFVMNPLYIYDDLLDVEKLRSSLERLVSREGFRKLGARLRKNDQGAYEHHIPADYTKERPPIGFTHVKHDMISKDHPVASRLPKPQRRPALVCDPAELADVFRGPESPKNMDDYLYTDRPQLNVHIVSFKDKTVISVYWPHSVFDGMGMKVMLNAWTSILQGKEDDIRPPHGFDRDVLSEFGKHATEPHKMEDRLMTTSSLVMYGLRNMVNLTLRGKENRAVCIPATFLEKLHATALAEFESEGQKNSWLSEGDVLSAWWLRLAISHFPRDSQRNVIVQNAFSMRSQLGKDLIPNGSGFLSNCTGYIYFVLPAKEIIQKSLGFVAWQFRQAIKEQATREQVEAYAALVRKSSVSAPPFFGDGSSHMVTFSNWTKALHFEVDLSSAAVKPRNTPCVPSYIQCVEMPYNFTEGFQILGKDAHGNYWLGGNRVIGLWGKIEEQLAQTEV